METKYPSEQGIAVGDLLDPTTPLVLWVILPAAVLGALGLRRGAILWIMACVVFMVATRVL